MLAQKNRTHLILKIITSPAFPVNDFIVVSMANRGSGSIPDTNKFITDAEMPTYGDLKSGFYPSGLPIPPPSINLPTPPPLLSPPPPPPKRTHPSSSSSFGIQECEFAGKQGTYVKNFYWLIGDPIKQSVIWL